MFEDDDTFAFMDVFPQGRGHTLVIHKRSKARNLLDEEPADPGALILDGAAGGPRGPRARSSPTASW